MTKRLLIDSSHAEETRVVVLDGNRLEDFDVETQSRRQLKGNIYLAKVVRVEPSLQAAFVEYGGNRHGFLAFGEIHPDYYQIPVADRQRLLALQEEEARAAAEEEAEEDEAEERSDRSPRRSHARDDGAAGAEAAAGAAPDVPAVADLAPDVDDAAAASGGGEGAALASEPAEPGAASAGAAAEAQQGGGETVPALPGAGADGAGVAAGTPVHAEAAADPLAADGAPADVAAEDAAVAAEVVARGTPAAVREGKAPRARRGRGAAAAAAAEAAAKAAEQAAAAAGLPEGAEAATLETAAPEAGVTASAALGAADEAGFGADVAPELAEPATPDMVQPDIRSGGTGLAGHDRVPGGGAEAGSESGFPYAGDARFAGDAGIDASREPGAGSAAEAGENAAWSADYAEGGRGGYGSAGGGTAGADFSGGSLSTGAFSGTAGPDNGVSGGQPGGYAAGGDAAYGESVGGEDESGAFAPGDGTRVQMVPGYMAPLPETIGGESDGDGMDEGRAPRQSQRFMRSYKIQEVIRRRQILLVQVVKEERGTKGAALTTYISMAGRYCVLMPNSPRGGGISRKITSAADRRRLREVTQELDIPRGMGLIVRTAGAARPKAEIKRDGEYLLRLWDDIRERTLRSVAPALIHEEASLIKRAIRDVYSRDVDELVVDGEEGWRAARDYMRMLMPAHAKKVQLWPPGGPPLFSHAQVEAQLDAMLSPVVQLRSGGYLVINQTEALVAIDVNSGRSTRERGIEETALRTNLEAADEAARQLRLRDLAGLIVIDFIDMESKKHNAMVERRMAEALKHDRARIQVGHISHFGLLELSRQRLRPSVAETSLNICEHCGGLGHVRSTESAALHVLREIEEEGGKRRASEIQVTLTSATALFILNTKRQRLGEIEQRYGMRVSFAVDDRLQPAQAQIERLRAAVPSDLPPPVAPVPVVDESTDLDVADEEDDVDLREVNGRDEERAGGRGEGRADERPDGRDGRGGRREGGAGRRDYGGPRRDEFAAPRRDWSTVQGAAAASGADLTGSAADAADDDETGEDDAADAADRAAGGAGDEAERRRRRRRRRRRGGRREDGSTGAAPLDGGDQPSVTARAFPVLPHGIDEKAVPGHDQAAEAVDEAGEGVIAASNTDIGFAAGTNSLPGAAANRDTAATDEGDDEGGPRGRRSRRGGRRRRKPGEDAAGAETPAPSQPAFPAYVGPTPADPFAFGAMDIFDVMEQAERREPAAPAAPEPVARSMPEQSASAGLAAVGTGAGPVDAGLAPEAPEPAADAGDTAAAKPEPEAGPVIRPVLIGTPEAPPAERRKGWWRR